MRGGQVQSITVKHNMEVSHRLSKLPGKCQNIHGHSMWVEMRLMGQVDDRGLLEGLDFGTVKGLFRGYLDETYDHHLLLNESDPLLTMLGTNDYEAFYPGLVECGDDPTTEHLALWICHWASDVFTSVAGIHVEVNETHVNQAAYTYWKS
jgi:6-pyruvoyltetrahydropterin/6-carboxytetrahydropterin synthase